MASKNIEINIKNAMTDSGSSDGDTYTTLYPKSLSKNIVYDTSTNISVEDKLSNLSPNDTFELGDILCTSKINVDTEKWHLCDGSELDSSQYPEIGNISNLSVFNSTQTISQYYIECNGYYFYSEVVQKTNTRYDFILYRIKIENFQSGSRDFESLILKSDTQSYIRKWGLHRIFNVDNYITVELSYKQETSSESWTDLYYCIIDNSFSLIYSSETLGARGGTIHSVVYNVSKNTIEIGYTTMGGGSTTYYWANKDSFNINTSTVTTDTTRFSGSERSGSVLLNMEDKNLIILVIERSGSSSSWSYTIYKAINPTTWLNLKNSTLGDFESLGTFSYTPWYIEGDFFVTTNGNYDTILSNFPNFRYNLINTSSPVCYSQYFSLMYTYSTTTKTFYEYQVTGDELNYCKLILNKTIYSNFNASLSPQKKILSGVNALIESLALPSINSQNSQCSYYIKVKP